MTYRTRIFRSHLRASVASGLLVAVAAGSAHAADTLVMPGIPTATTTVNAGISANNNLQNRAAVQATIDDAHGRIGVNGAQTGTGNTVGANTIAASAQGNNATSAISDLLLLEQGGAGALNYAVNSGTITSGVTDSDLSVNLNGFQSGSASNVGNTISAASTLNVSNTSVQGALPNGFSSTTSAGSRTAIYPLEAHGTVLASSMQQGEGTGHSATVEANAILLSVGVSPGNPVTASADLADNRISAAFKGNSSTTSIEMSGGGAPSFQGSAAATNIQTNLVSAAFGTTTVTNSQIKASITGATPGSATVGVTGNRIDGIAAGNEALGDTAGAGNRIYLGDGLSFAGTGPSLTGSAFVYSGPAGSGGAVADLVAYNGQSNVGMAGRLRATMTNNTVGATVDTVPGSIDVSNNAIAAAASGNVASNGISTGEGAASFAGTAAVASNQLNSGLIIASENTSGTANATVGMLGGNPLAGSDVSVAGNSVSARSFGNRVSQGLSLDANSVDIGNGIALLGTNAPSAMEVTGAATVATMQRNVGASVSATNAQSTVGISSLNQIERKSQLTVSGNAQEAVAVGNSGDNGLALKGDRVGTGAGIASVQMSDAGSAATALLSDAKAAIATNNLDGSSVGLTGNLQRAIAYSSTASNETAVHATTIALVPSSSEMNGASVTTLQPELGGGALHGFGTPKTQAAYALLNDQTNLAAVSGTVSDALLQVAISGTVTGSGVKNDGNATVAAAYGTDADNGIAIDATSMGTGINGGHASVAATTSAQTSTGNITAAITKTGQGPAGIQTTAQAISNSTVSTSDNVMQATAYGNRLTGNSITVAATDVSTPARFGQASGRAKGDGETYTADAAFAAQNVQYASGQIRASLGDTMVPDITTTVGPVTNARVNSDGNLLAARAGANSASNQVALSANNLATTAAVQNVQSSQASVAAESGAAAFPGALPYGGVTVSAGGLSAASVSADDNIAAASAIGNGASNSLSASSNTISAASGQFDTSAGLAFGNVIQAHGDYSLANIQSSQQRISGDIVGKFGIQATGPVIGSTISVSGNSQSGSAIANTAVNQIALSGNDISAGAALASTQTGASPLSSSSQLSLFAPTAATGSTVKISGNSNLALSVMNDVANTLSVSGANIDPVNQPVLAVLSPTLATGDRVIANSQTAGGGEGTTINASASTSLQAPGSQLDASSLTVEGNSTTAEASANRATNLVSLDAGAILGGNAGVVNAQTSSAAVSATAQTDATLTFATGSPSGSLTQSTLSLQNNSTTALARGNTASNTLNATAGAGYDGGGKATDPINSACECSQSVSATAGILNNQSNNGAVSATSANTAYRVALNGTTGSTVGLAGNSIVAQASGNSAVNRISLTALNGTSPSAAINNRQSNTAAISASVTGATIGVTGSGMNGGSTLGVTGNKVTASAVGNSVSSVVGSK